MVYARDERPAFTYDAVNTVRLLLQRGEGRTYGRCADAGTSFSPSIIASAVSITAAGHRLPTHAAAMERVSVYINARLIAAQDVSRTFGAIPGAE